jgi:hypothetical protein
VWQAVTIWLKHSAAIKRVRVPFPVLLEVAVPDEAVTGLRLSLQEKVQK